jgi:hypothetical protein
MAAFANIESKIKMENFILDTFNDKIEIFSEDVFRILYEDVEFKKEEQLYHYTSLEALQDIIKNQSLRASNIYMMNDPNELVHGQKHICDWFSNDISNKLSWYLKGNSSKRFSAFVFSLSEISDDMHLWEKYGNNHRGIRIGFTPKNLVEYWRKIDRISVFLAPVVYHDFGTNFLEPYGNEFKSFKNEFINTINSYFIENTMTDIDLQNLVHCSSIIATMIKRKEWSSEKEWRIVCLTSGPYHKNIIGEFNNGESSIKLENKCSDTLKMLTNSGHDSIASKDVLKIGCNAGEKEHIEYVLSLLFPPRIIMTVSQSLIQT